MPAVADDAILEGFSVTKPKDENLNFVQAIQMVKTGKLVRRKGWTGLEEELHVGCDDAKELFFRNGFFGISVTTNAFFELDDFLASDWEVVS